MVSKQKFLSVIYQKYSLSVPNKLKSDRLWPKIDKKKTKPKLQKLPHHQFIPNTKIETQTFQQETE